MVTEPTGKTYLPSYSAMYAATFPSLVGLECNSAAMVTAMGVLEKQTWKAGMMHGYAHSASGYPANLQIGLAAAADSAVPNAQAAWNLFDSRSVKPNGTTAYNNYPNFAVMPRFVDASADPVAPATEPDPTPTPPAEPPPPAQTPPPAVPPPVTKPADPPVSRASDWRRPGSPVRRVLNVLDQTFSYFEVLPRLLPYEFVKAARSQGPAAKPTSQQAPRAANLAPRPAAPVSSTHAASQPPIREHAVGTDCRGCVTLISRAAIRSDDSVKCAAGKPGDDRATALARAIDCRDDRLRR